ncbi:MAG: 2-hydroxy-3-oxopropionate reductase [Betaproteobacteria bacterium HGW-Betaproteobacteria-11]|nr:MAG: 2-hydroxy-3-oxopropionate reductase [Betaproteobacteria bacterium HGW-Betaproteobacteria-11]
MHIGFIGLGLMGRPMALHFARAGHVLHLWARRQASFDPFATARTAGQAQFHASPADVARQAEVVFTMVAAGQDVETICFGENGLVHGAAPGTLMVDMSTIGAQAARSIGERLAARGLEFVDAPVSGGEAGAIDATLSIMVGGRAECVEKLRPLFTLLGRSVTHVGTCGAGQVAKSCNQILAGVTVLAVAEALHLARQSGVDPAKVREALLGGFAYSKILEHHGRRMLEGNFKPGFKTWMQQKDLRLVMEEAHRLGLMLPSAATATQMFNALVGHGLGEEDTVAMLKLLEAVAAPERGKDTN